MTINISAVLRALDHQGISTANGICHMITTTLQELDRIDNVPYPRAVFGIARAIYACLADGYEHFVGGGDHRFPIAHPTTENAESAYYWATDKWDEATEYGRRRRAALAFVVERAEQFRIVDSRLLYTPVGADAALAIRSFVLRDESVGICRNLSLAFGRVVAHTVTTSVKECLAEGFPFYDDFDYRFPIAAPSDLPLTGFVYGRVPATASREAYIKHPLWDEATEYGRRRREALRYIQDRAESFVLARDGTLTYAPVVRALTAKDIREGQWRLANPTAADRAVFERLGFDVSSRRWESSRNNTGCEFFEGRVVPLIEEEEYARDAVNPIVNADGNFYWERDL